MKPGNTGNFPRSIRLVREVARRADFGVATYGEEPSIRNSDGLSLRLRSIHRVDHAVQQDQFGFSSCSRQGTGAKHGHKIATSEVHILPCSGTFVLYAR